MNSDSSLILDSIFFRVPQLSILEGVYLKVLPGRICALFGRNGAGKSTLLKIATGQLLADSGITIINGQRIHNRALGTRFSKIGYLPQESMLPDDISVRRVLKSVPARDTLIEDPLINRMISQKVLELSGGERRYLETSLLFCLDRDYFLLDEPFTGVEPNIIEKLIDRIKKEAGKGRGILLTDHYHRFVLQVADEAYLMQQKQCYKLEGNFRSQLQEMGYLGT